MSIYFKEETFNMVLNDIKEAHDTADILHDLYRIDNVKHKVISYGYTGEALQLNEELRHKYPFIDIMLNTFDRISVNKQNSNNIDTDQKIALSLLNQDHCGIIRDTAIKKGYVQCLGQLIDKVQ